MNVEIRGRGSPVVLLHGWGMNLRVFDGLADALAADHEVHAVDLPGHGRSPFDPAESSFDAQVAQLASVVPRGASLLGWSLGGQFAMALARRAEAHRLVLIAATPKFVDGDGWTAGVGPGLLDTFATQLRSDWQCTLDEFLALQVRGSAQSARVLATLRQALQAHGMPSTAALATGLELLATNDLRAIVPALDLPTLVIAGQHDRVTPPAAAHWLAARLSHVRAEEVARAGHAPFLSHPEHVATLVREHLAAAK